MDVKTKLSEQFYNLSSTSPAQSKKNFNTYINDLNNKIPHDALKAELIGSLNPRNVVEIKFKTDLLLHYQLYDKALELLKHGDNLIYTFKILKAWHFFKEIFKNISADAFVNEILPQMSYFTRVKVLNRLSKTFADENLADEYFESIENKYGILLANIMLTCCSIDLIKKKIEKYNMILKYTQLLSIVKRNVEFLEYYFERTQRDSRFRNTDKHRLVKMIFNHNQDLFWKLSEKYEIVTRCGKRLSKKILKQKEHLLISDDSCKVLFAKRAVYQQLRNRPEMFKQFILNRTSDDMKAFCNTYLDSCTDISKFVTFVSKERRYQFLNYYFKEKFGYELHEKPKCITHELLLLMPKELRNSVLEVKIKQDEDLIYLYAPEISFHLVMDKIKHCSDMNTRVKYIETLYNTCEYNNNAEYLLKALQYMETRHRNDTVALRRFVENLRSWPNIEALSIEHWNCINALQKILTIQDQYLDETYFLVKWIGHLLDNNLDISEPMQKYLEIVNSNTHYFLWSNIFSEIPRHRKYCILEFRKYIDKMENKEESEKMLVRYINFVDSYNEDESVKDKIPIKDFFPIIKQLAQKNIDGLQYVISSCVRLYYTELNSIIWKHIDSFFCQQSLFSWYFLHHTDEMLDNINFLLQVPWIRKNKKFIRNLSDYSFRNMPEIVTRFCVNVLGSDTSDVSFKVDVIDILAMINQDEFITMSMLFNPSEDGKIYPNESTEEVALFEALLKNIKTLLNPIEGLPILSRFCKGDYLKYALLPLYSITSKVPERTAVSFLMELHKKAVSVRKHTIHLSKIIFPIDEFCCFIKEQVDSEKNPSLKSILFKKSLECAAISPIPKFWELLKITMHGIDKDDVKAHDLLLQIDSVPTQYRAAYIPEAYEQLNLNKNVHIREKRFNIICDTPKEVINQLDYQLLELFLSEIMFTEEAYYLPDYWTNFIFYTTGEKQSALFDFVLKRFEKYWNNTNSKYIKINEEKFTLNFCQCVLKFYPDSSLMSKFSTLWFNIFPPEINLRRHMYVTFIHHYVECGYNLKAFALKAKELLQAFITAYDRYLIDTFAGELKMFLNNRNSADIIQFITVFSENFFTIPACLVSIQLLAIRTPEKHEVKEQKEYLAFITRLQDRPEKCIKVYLHNHLHNYMKNES